MKEIKDYLHLYMKCWGDLERVDDGFLFKYYENAGWALSGALYQEIMVYGHKFTPHLRSINSMTEDEIIEQETLFRKYEPEFKQSGEMRKKAIDRIRENGINAIKFDSSQNPIMIFEMFHYLLSRHFDLFNLIPSGLAIDSTKVK